MEESKVGLAAEKNPDLRNESLETLDVQNIIFNPSNHLTFNFDGKTNETAKASLSIQNKSEFSVAFKIKTTSPRDYSVKPPAGIIRPNGIQDVVINYHTKCKQTSEERSKHKFLIMCAKLDVEIDINSPNLVRDVNEYCTEILDTNRNKENTPPSIMQRFKCEFVYAEKDTSSKMQTDEDEKQSTREDSVDYEPTVQKARLRQTATQTSDSDTRKEFVKHTEEHSVQGHNDTNFKWYTIVVLCFLSFLVGIMISK